MKELRRLSRYRRFLGTMPREIRNRSQHQEELDELEEELAETKAVVKLHVLKGCIKISLYVHLLFGLAEYYNREEGESFSLTITYLSLNLLGTSVCTALIDIEERFGIVKSLHYGPSSSPAGQYAFRIFYLYSTILIDAYPIYVYCLQCLKFHNLGESHRPAKKDTIRFIMIALQEYKVLLALLTTILDLPNVIKGTLVILRATVLFTVKMPFLLFRGTLIPYRIAAKLLGHIDQLATVTLTLLSRLPTTIVLWTLQLCKVAYMKTQQFRSDSVKKLRKWMDLQKVERDFLEACKCGGKATMRRLLAEHEGYINVNQMRAQDGGDTALHLACRGGHVAIVESLLSLSGKTTKKRIVDVNIENAAGETPVSIAARAGHAGIVRRILKAKGFKMRKEQGERAAAGAIEGGHYEAAFLLMSAMENKLGVRERVLLSCLSRHVKLTHELKSAKSEDDARDINARLETYRKSIRANVSSSSDNSEGSDTKIETNNHAPGEKSVEESIEEVREYLECAICCENFADLTVFACTKDHWICARCLPRNESCPFCREDFKARPPTRRVTYEKFLAVVTEHLAIVEEKLNCDEINKSN